MTGAGIVYIIDDDPFICDLFAANLRPTGLTVKIFTSAAAFAQVDLAADVATIPACILLDLDMPGTSGLELLEQRFNGHPPCPVIIVTGKGSIGAAVQSMKLGAVDFLEKPFAMENLRTLVLDALARHQNQLAQKAQRDVLRARLASLSPREAELLAAIVQGQSTKMIADSLGISARTVDHHRANLMDKMRANNVADVVRMAVEADYQTIPRPRPASPDNAPSPSNG